MKSRWVAAAMMLLLAGSALGQMTGTVTGTVADTEGLPLVNARVVLHDGDHMGGGGMGGGMGGGGMGGGMGGDHMGGGGMGGGDPQADHNHGGMSDYETWTDENGEFTLDDVETGDYEARAMLAGYGMDEVEITVESMQTVTVDFILEMGNGHGGGHMGGHGMHEWEEIELSGWTIVEENDMHDFFYLDEENDGIADWRLGFGPPGYEPPSGAELPNDGDEISIVGGQMTMGGWMHDLPMVMVFELNGETWFEPDSMGGHHNGHGGEWHQEHDACSFEHPTSDMASGWVMMDNDADAHNMYWLDIDDDQQADLRLSYGLLDYEPGNGAERPHAGDWAEIVGGMIEGCPEHPTMVVYEHNGVFWREPGDINGLEPTALSVGEGSSVSIPGNHLIVTAYPNPFNPETIVRAILPEEANVTVDIYDVLGRQIVSIDRGVLEAGAHSMNIDASSWSAGVYFVRVQAGTQQEITKIQLIR